MPGLRCCAYLQFAWFAVGRELTDLYQEVLGIMDKSMRDGDLVFPAAQYKYFGALALISGALGDLEHATRMARNALDAAAKDRSPFVRHRRVGLVSNTDSGVYRRIEQLAG